MAKRAVSLGVELRKLVRQSGLTQDEVARGMGFKRASSIQRYLEDSYGESGPLKIELASKFAQALVGKGSPPITNEDVFSLAGVEITERGTLKATTIDGALSLGIREHPVEGGPRRFVRQDVFELPKDLPSYGTALGGTLEFIGSDNQKIAIEQTNLRVGDVIEYYRRPPQLAGNDAAHVLHVQGSSMEPKFEDGEVILVDPRRPVHARDYVIVTLKRQEMEGDEPEAACVMVKRLVKRTADYLDLEQFQPPAVFRVPMSRVMRIAPVIPWGDAMGF